MRVVSPIAMSALAAISAQNLVDSVVRQTLLNAAATVPPAHTDLVDDGKTAKSQPVQPTAGPETLALQQFTGVVAPLELGLSWQPQALAVPTSQSAAAFNLPAATVAAEPVATAAARSDLPPLDPIVDQVIQAELRLLAQENPAVARGFNPPPEPMITARLASPPQRDDSDARSHPLPSESDRPIQPPANLTPEWVSLPAPVVASEPIAPPAKLIPASPQAADSLPQPAVVTDVSEFPDYLLPQRAAAVGFDRIPASQAPSVPVETVDPQLAAPPLPPDLADTQATAGLAADRNQVPIDSIEPAGTVALPPDPTQPAVAPPFAPDAALPLFSGSAPSAPIAAAPEFSELTGAAIVPVSVTSSQAAIAAATLSPRLDWRLERHPSLNAQSRAAAAPEIAELNQPQTGQLPAAARKPAATRQPKSAAAKSIRVDIVGQIALPGEFELPAHTSLHQAIQQAGGVVDRQQPIVQLIRRHPDGSVSLQTIAGDFAPGNDPNPDLLPDHPKNPLLQDKDVIVVNRVSTRQLTRSFNPALLESAPW